MAFIHKVLRNNFKPDEAWKHDHEEFPIGKKASTSEGGWPRVKQHHFQPNLAWIGKLWVKVENEQIRTIYEAGTIRNTALRYTSMCDAYVI